MGNEATVERKIPFEGSLTRAEFLPALKRGGTGTIVSTGAQHMPKITYVEEHKVKVYFNSKLVGTIRKELSADGKSEGYRYYPKGDKVGGDLFFSLTRCKHSLEN